MIVKRSLMVTAVGAVIPVPVMDEYVAGRVRAGLLIKLAQLRNVDLPPSSAELLGDPREASMVRNATLTAITLVALKLAWRKIFAVLAAGGGRGDVLELPVRHAVRPLLRDPCTWAGRRPPSGPRTCAR